MLWRKEKKYLPAEEAITRGDSTRMEIKYDIAAEGDLKRMKIRTGYNQNEKMYYIQITERETLLSYRIYLTDVQFKDLVIHMGKTYQFETIDKESEAKK
jgi:hypothetical protein